MEAVVASFTQMEQITAALEKAVEFKENKLERALEQFGAKFEALETKLDAINAKNPMQRNYAERQAINAPIQGSAADIIKRAMIRVPPVISAAGLDARMLLQVHDELLFEAPEEQVEKTIDVVKETMEAAALPILELKVPLVVDAGTGDDWATAH